MADDASGPTEKEIFGSDSDSESLPCDEPMEEDRDSSQSAAVSSKKLRTAPEGGNLRVRLSVAQKMEAMKHYEANPGMSYPKLVDWCYRQSECEFYKARHRQQML